MSVKNKKQTSCAARFIKVSLKPIRQLLVVFPVTIGNLVTATFHLAVLFQNYETHIVDITRCTLFGSLKKTSMRIKLKVG